MCLCIAAFCEPVAFRALRGTRRMEEVSLSLNVYVFNLVSAFGQRCKDVLATFTVGRTERGSLKMNGRNAAAVLAS